MLKQRENPVNHHISIVVPVFNRIEFIEEAIQSALMQDYDHYDLIIVDDGSTNPEVSKVLGKYGREERVTVYRKAKGGPGSALNFGATKVKGEYFCRLDSDDRLSCDALSVLNRNINAYPQVDYFYSSRCAMNARSEITTKPWKPGKPVHKSVIFSREKLIEEYICKHLICFKKRKYLQAGGMREDIMWAEDWEFALRMSQQWSFRNIDDVLYFVREYAGNKLSNTIEENKKKRITQKITNIEREKEILKINPDHDHLHWVRKRFEKKNKNILFINNVSGLFGAESSMLELVRNLNHGHTPVVVLPYKGPLQEILEQENIKVIIYDSQMEPERGKSRTHHYSDNPEKKGKSFREDLHIFNFLNETIKKYDIDIVHFNKCFGFIAQARIVTWMNKIPLIVHIRGAVDIDRDRRAWLAKADKIVFVANHSREHLMKGEEGKVLRKVHSEKIDVIYNGRQLDQYTFSPVKRKTVRQKLNLSEHDVVIALIGYFDPLKGQDRFVSLAKELADAGESFKFLLIGEVVNHKHNSYRDAVIDSIERFGLKDKIILTGFLDCREALSAIDILVSLSSSEGLPGVIIEAMANQRTVIANNVGGIPEIIGDNGAGFTVEDYDTARIKKIIIRLSKNRDEMKSIGIKAHNRVNALFPIDQHVVNIEQVYEFLRIKKIYDLLLEQNKKGLSVLSENELVAGRL